jgi:hypothetical protein
LLSTSDHKRDKNHKNDYAQLLRSAFRYLQTSATPSAIGIHAPSQCGIARIHSPGMWHSFMPVLIQAMNAQRTAPIMKQYPMMVVSILTPPVR